MYVTVCYHVCGVRQQLTLQYLCSLKMGNGDLATEWLEVLEARRNHFLLARQKKANVEALKTMKHASTCVAV